MGFSRQEHWSGLPFSSPGDLPNWASCIVGRFSTVWAIREMEKMIPHPLHKPSGWPSLEVWCCKGLGLEGNCKLWLMMIVFSSRLAAFLSSLLQFSLVTQSCLTLCDPMNCSMPGLPVHHQLLESTQTHVHWVGDAIQPFHPLSSPSPPALNLSFLLPLLLSFFQLSFLSLSFCLVKWRALKALPPREIAKNHRMAGCVT